jgi:hypothetical protein
MLGILSNQAPWSVPDGNTAVAKAIGHDHIEVLGAADLQFVEGSELPSKNRSKLAPNEDQCRNGFDCIGLPH